MVAAWALTATIPRRSAEARHRCACASIARQNRPATRTYVEVTRGIGRRRDEVPLARSPARRWTHRRSGRRDAHSGGCRLAGIARPAFLDIEGGHSIVSRVPSNRLRFDGHPGRVGGDYRAHSADKPSLASAKRLVSVSGLPPFGMHAWRGLQRCTNRPVGRTTFRCDSILISNAGARNESTRLERVPLHMHSRHLLAS